jgi:CRP-like cAMP-binding protein
VRVALIREPGAILGEMSVLLDLPHTATARALTSGRAYELEHARTFLHSRPDTAIFLAPNSWHVVSTKRLRPWLTSPTNFRRTLTD